MQHKFGERGRDSHGNFAYAAACFAFGKRERIHNSIGKLLLIFHNAALISLILAYPCTVDNNAVLSVRAANQAYYLGTANIQHGSVLTHGASIRTQMHGKDILFPVLKGYHRYHMLCNTFTHYNGI